MGIRYGSFSVAGRVRVVVNKRWLGKRFRDVLLLRKSCVGIG